MPPRNALFSVDTEKTAMAAVFLLCCLNERESSVLFPGLGGAELVQQPNGQHDYSNDNEDTHHALEGHHEGFGKGGRVKMQIHTQTPFSVSHYQGEDQSPGNDGSNLSTDIGPGGMHEQVVEGVFLPAHLMYHTGGHGEGRDARRTDHGIHLILAEQVQQLCKHYAAHGVEDEGNEPQQQNGQSLHSHKVLRLHSESNGDAQQQGNEVGQLVLGAVAEGVEHTALPNEVTKHKEANELRRLGGNGTGHNGNDDGEENPGGLADGGGGIGHANAPFLLGGDELDDGGLHNGHKGHIGVSRHHDSTLIVGFKHVGHIDRSRAVRSANDGDGSSILQREANEPGHNQGEEDTKLSRRPEKHHLGVGEQGAKVNHGADADEQQQREQLRGDTRIEQGLNGLRIDHG